MKKRTKKLKPQLGGLNPIKKNNIEYLEKVTRSVILHHMNWYFRGKNNEHIDYIEVYVTKQTKHEDGTIMSSHLMERPLFIIRDTVGKAEYDVFEESLWNQEDIDNPAYLVNREDSTVDPDTQEEILGAVNRIYYVDGQEDDGEGNMEDIEIDIDPYQKQGRIDESTEVILFPPKEPLAEVQANVGEYLNTLIKGKLNDMYN